MHTRPILQDRHASRRLTSLDVSDVDLDKGEVTLKLKKKRSNRVLFLDNELLPFSKGLAARKTGRAQKARHFLYQREGQGSPRKAQRRLSRRMRNVLACIMNNQTMLKIDLFHIAVDIGSLPIFSPLEMSRDFVKELRGDARGEVIDI